jgi:hypothetical protein
MRVWSSSRKLTALCEKRQISANFQNMRRGVKCREMTCVGVIRRWLAAIAEALQGSLLLKEKNDANT